METSFAFYTWKGLFSLAVWLFCIFWALQILVYLFERLAPKNLTTKKIISVINKGFLIFKPLALILLLLGFISVNYITHTILLLIIGVSGYHHIKNYVFGIFLRVNPLVNPGAIIQLGDIEGELKNLLPFGVIINTEKGEQYINYTSIENTGFLAKSNEESVLRQTLYLKTSMRKEDIMDLLFDNPIIDFTEKPSLKDSEKEFLRLQYTLENGASTEDLLAFLNAKKIETSLTKLSN